MIRFIMLPNPMTNIAVYASHLKTNTESKANSNVARDTKTPKIIYLRPI